MISRILNCIYVIFLRFLLTFGVDRQNESVMSYIKADLYRFAASVDLNKAYKIILNEPGFQFAFFLRLASLQPKSAWRKRVHAISYFFHKKYFFKFGYQIPICTRIGKGFQILHFGQIIFNPSAQIGENCTIFPGVTIGQDKDGFSPVIGNKVWIGSNSIIVGGIIIGNNVLIAPGSYVNFNVPDNCLVIGNPGKFIVKSVNITDGYLNNVI